MVPKTLWEINDEFMTANAAIEQSAGKSAATAAVEIPLREKTEAQPPNAGETAATASHTRRTEPKDKEKKNKTALAAAADILFYLMVMVMFLSLLTLDTDGGRPKTVLGYSYFTVLGDSMKDEIPRGALIFVRETPGRDLQIGDNITFLRDRHDPVTHKITAVLEGQDGEGAAFQTKGTNNINPDTDIVYEADIIGRVVFAVPKIGAAIAYLGSNIYIVFIIFGLYLLISFGVRMKFREPKAGSYAERRKIRKQTEDNGPLKDDN